MKVFTEPRQKKLFESVRKFYETHEYDYGHCFDHVIRVIWWCLFLSKKEKADLSILLPAAILHDIGKFKGAGGSHAKTSYRMCRSFLKKYDYNENEIKKIAEVILAHSVQYYRKQRTIEGKVMFDADKLDAVNAIGLHRWVFEYSTNGRHDVTIRKILIDVKKWKHDAGKNPFYTKTGKRIGYKGVQYIEKVFNDTAKDFKKFRKIYKEFGLE